MDAASLHLRPVRQVHLRRPRVELLPLIDVFFILLAFFIYGIFSMTMRQGIDVDLPGAKSSQPQQQDAAVTLSLDAQGRLFFNGELLNVTDLPKRVQQLKAAELSEPIFLIQADEQVPYGHTLTVLDVLRQQGIQHIALQTEPLELPDEAR